MLKCGLVGSASERHLALNFRPTTISQHNRCAAVFVLPQEPTNWVIHLRQVCEVTASPATCHKSFPSTFLD